ncbi:CoA transferase, partial [Microbacterium sp. 18062]|uniref:CoA transferase n=1 Tax=Microbacterium sp. 18062 TaxID=2681410 RepID=UPI00190F8C8F
ERPDLAADPALAHNDGRVKQVILLAAAIEEWTRQSHLNEVLASLNEGGIPAGKIYDASDIANDPHYKARDMLLPAHLPDGTPVILPGIVPKLLSTPGRVRHEAPELGQHTGEVLSELGINANQIITLKAKGIV